MSTQEMRKLIETVESINSTPLDDFTYSYIRTALWSTNDNSDEMGGEPLEKNYNIHNISKDTLDKMINDSKKFQKLAGDNLNIGSLSQAGHDFWLTRNGHGAGFWDGDWPEPEATELTKLSKSFGEFDLYVGDDGKIHSY